MSIKKLLTCLLLATAVCSAVFALADAAVEEFWDYSYTVDKTVYVNASDGLGLYMRYGPGTEYGKVNDQTIPNGSAVHITKECTAANGWKWGWCDYTFPGQSYTDSGWICLVETSVQAPADAVPAQQTEPAREEADTADAAWEEADTAEEAAAVQAPAESAPEAAATTYSSMSLVIIGITVGVAAAAAVGLILSRRKK